MVLEVEIFCWYQTFVFLRFRNIKYKPPLIQIGPTENDWNWSGDIQVTTEPTLSSSQWIYYSWFVYCFTEVFICWVLKDQYYQHNFVPWLCISTYVICVNDALNSWVISIIFFLLLPQYFHISLLSQNILTPDWNLCVYHSNCNWA